MALNPQATTSVQLLRQKLDLGAPGLTEAVRLSHNTRKPLNRSINLIKVQVRFYEDNQGF